MRAAPKDRLERAKGFEPPTQSFSAGGQQQNRGPQRPRHGKECGRPQRTAWSGRRDSNHARSALARRANKRLEGSSDRDMERNAGSPKGPPGAGEGIRTLDPNLGKVVLYP